MSAKHSHRGAIAAGHPLTAAAGAEMLELGGNAVDAALAAVLASFVTESPLTGPGAGGFMLVHDGRHSELLDFFVAVPGRGRQGPWPEPSTAEIRFGGTTTVSYRIGGPTVAVPGLLRGLSFAHARHGSLPWSELFAPALRLAREGIVVNEAQDYLQRVTEPILRRDEAGRALYGAERLLAAGQRLYMPELAASLELVAAQGVDVFYEGELAEGILSYLAEHDGVLTKEDLATYKVIVRRPVATRYRGYDFLSNPPPAAGGTLVAYALALLERLGPPSARDDPDAVTLLAEVARQASSARDARFSAALYDGDPVAELLSPERLRRDSEEVAARLANLGLPSSLAESPGPASTTQVSVIDASGQAVSLTSSTGAATSMIIPGLGLSLNNLLGESDLLPSYEGELEPFLAVQARAGERLSSMMSPSLLLEGGQPVMSLGSAGSTRLRSAIVQIVVNSVDRGLALAEALATPRTHLEGDVLHLEGQAELVAPLQQRGYQVQLWPDLDFFFGGAAAVRKTAHGFEAAGDPRRGGTGAIVD